MGEWTFQSEGKIYSKHKEIKKMTALMKTVAAMVLVWQTTLILSSPSNAEQKEFKLGVLFCLTGAVSHAGALAGYRGSMVAIDMINDRGGIAGQYKVVPVTADAQSDPGIAIREARRLMTEENVPVVLGVYSSTVAIPLAPVVEKERRVFWVISAVSDKVLEDRNLQYVFRVMPMGSQYGMSTVDLIRQNYAKFGRSDPKDIRIAMIHEDGPYGTSTSAACSSLFNKHDMKLVLNEAYSVQTKDLSSLIRKLKDSKPDAVIHTGYFSDVVLFLRQARELGLKTKGIVGQGSGYANFSLLRKTVEASSVLYVFNVATAPAQTLDPGKLGAGQKELIAEFLQRYAKKWGEPSPPAQATQGFGHTWVLLNDVASLALKKHAGLDSESIRRAACEVDVPEGATPCGYGVKFAPSEDKFAGQNIRSYPVVTQWTKSKLGIVWPASMKTVEPVIPMPEDSPYSTK